MMRNGLVLSAAVMTAVALVACGDPPISGGTKKGDLQFLLPDAGSPVRSGTYDFGEVPAGTFQAVTFEVINVGTDLARVTARKFEQAQVGVFFADAPTTVPPGESAPIKLTFAPPASGDYSGRFVLEHDGDALSATLNLTGTAVAENP